MVSHEEVGRRVRQAREDLAISQAELGRRLTPPRTHAAVSDIERGKTKLDVDDLSMLSAALDRPVVYFYGDRPAASVVYRRGDRDLTPELQRETDRAVDLFKQFARQHAPKRPAQ